MGPHPPKKKGKKIMEETTVQEDAGNEASSPIDHEALETHFEEYEMSKMPGS